jgi:hypothetical protein
MTDQPRELFRFLLYLSFLMSMCFAAHILGIAVTALMNVKVRNNLLRELDKN